MHFHNFYLDDHIYYRTGTNEDPKSIGTGWQKLPGSLKYISSGKTIWGVNSANAIYYMKNINNNNGALTFQWVQLMLKGAVDGKLKQISASSGYY